MPSPGPRRILADPRALAPPQDEPRAALVSEVSPGPGKDHHEAVPEADQKEDVDGQPGDPGHEAGELEGSDHGHRRAAPDGGERAFVHVAEGQERLAPPGAKDVVTGVPPPLDGGGGRAPAGSGPPLPPPPRGSPGRTRVRCSGNPAPACGARSRRGRPSSRLRWALPRPSRRSATSAASPPMAHAPPPRRPRARAA